MAKYMIRHECGCEVEHSLFGKNDSREWKISKLQEEKCYNCQQKIKVEEMINSGEYEEKEVHYSEYKESGLTALPNTYNKDTKTIKVLIKKEEPVKYENQIIEEVKQELNSKAVNEEIILTQEELNRMNKDLNNVCKKYKLDTNKIKDLFSKCLNDNYTMTVNKKDKILKLVIKK